MTAFSSLPLPPALARAIDVLGFHSLTAIQERALPLVLAGDDVIAQARTGSGKTVAFGLGLLGRIDVGRDVTQALVLCPTRELAEQVSTELRRLGRFVPNLRVVTLCGGVPARTQLPALQRAPHVVVGTPGRVLDHLGRESVSFAALRVAVLDEADRMLDMGFVDAIDDVLGRAPGARQTLLFSATFPEDVRALSGRYQREPREVTVADVPETPAISQRFYAVEPDGKLDALVALLHGHALTQALVFTHTRTDARDVAAALAERGVSALALHGDLEQREREEVLARFANKSATVLVATDVAARGLDIQGQAAIGGLTEVGVIA